MTRQAAKGRKKERNSLAEVAYDSVFRMILSRELPGGTVIQERKLADALGISRTPTREALVRLEGEGWLVRLTERLLSVKVVTLEEYLQALSVRQLLECDAIEAAVGNLTPERVAELRRMLDKLTADAKPTNEAHWAFDDALHNGIADAGGNAVAARIIRNLRNITRLFESQTVPQRLRPGIAEHEAILTALESGKAARARKAMARHLEQVRAGVLDNL